MFYLISSTLSHLYSRSHRAFQETESRSTDSSNHDPNEIVLSDECTSSDSFCSLQRNTKNGSATCSTSSNSARHYSNTIKVPEERIDFPPLQRRTEIDVTRPHLLVLGTGCAAPSPLRGEFIRLKKQKGNSVQAS